MRDSGDQKELLLTSSNGSNTTSNVGLLSASFLANITNRPEPCTCQPETAKRLGLFVIVGEEERLDGKRIV
ncbi:ferritin-3 [Pyrus ussuriensis x Pyrus communis]|uniref:Ferritin-3 n=1 Tax=Pyrus ussuriensis x Pyrus communis TaxID=2448454 RepID=A0A5N5GMS2_9ROSA|nr:ferritin-3 [Pyrus ussuriensis x Pyrus communis]